jgi:hypothetical protein
VPPVPVEPPPVPVPVVPPPEPVEPGVGAGVTVLGVVVAGATGVTGTVAVGAGLVEVVGP